MGRATTTIEKRLVEGFLKSVGGAAGLYNPITKTLKDDIETEPLYQENLRQIIQALKEGWVASELGDFIFTRYKAGERAALLSEILPAKAPGKKVDEDENLLDPTIDYQHPALYRRYAPVYQGDVCIQRGQVEALEGFTIRDLAEYFYGVMRLPNLPRTWPAAIGAFHWLLGQARVDELLHAIDLAAEESDTTPVLSLARHLEEAREIVCERESRRLGIA